VDKMRAGGLAGGEFTRALPLRVVSGSVLRGFCMAAGDLNPLFGLPFGAKDIIQSRDVRQSSPKLPSTSTPN
jgi:hypothetical protein